jgi:hypothetical protein
MKHKLKATWEVGTMTPDGPVYREVTQVEALRVAARLLGITPKPGWERRLTTKTEKR